MSKYPNRGVPHKLSMAMRTLLEARGIDLIEMQMNIYKKAMEAYDNHRGDNEKSDAGPAYLSVANQAVNNMMKYAFPTMTAVKIDDLREDPKDQEPIDAKKIRERILNDPFSKAVAEKIKITEETKDALGVPLLVTGKKDE